MSDQERIAVTYAQKRVLDSGLEISEERAEVARQALEEFNDFVFGETLKGFQKGAMAVLASVDKSADEYRYLGDVKEADALDTFISMELDRLNIDAREYERFKSTYEIPE